LGSGRSLTSQSIRSLAWESVSRVGQQGLTFLSTAILAHLLTPAAYGVMGMAGLFLNFASTVNELGIPAAIVQWPETNQRMLSSLFWFNLLLGLGVSATLFGAGSLAATFFHEPLVRSILQVLALTFFIASLGNVQHALLYREMNLRPAAMAQIISSVAGLAVAVGMALQGMGVWSLVGSALTARVMDSALMWVLHSWRPSFHFRWSDCRPVLRFGVNLAGFGVVNFLSRNADNLIVGRMLGSAPLGYYQNSYNLMYYPQQTLNSTISNVMLAALSKTQADKERFGQAVLRLATMFGFLLFPMMLGMAVTADLIVGVVLGPQWAPAGQLLAILAVAGFLQGFSAPTGQIYIATGKTDVLFRWSLITSSATVLGFLAGVRWGTVGVAAGFTIAQAVLLYPLLRVALRLIDLPVGSYLRVMLPPMWLSLAMAAVVGAWRWSMAWAGVTQQPLLLASSVSLGVLTYAALTWLTRPERIRDMLEVLGNTDIVMLRGPVIWLKEKWG
jgi:PST family polysaccharide transporter